MSNGLEIEIEITGDIDFENSLVWEHVDNSIADSCGVTPQKDDYKLIFP